MIYILYNNYVNPCDQHFERLRKENYVVNSLIRTLYSENLNNSEIYHVVQKFNREIAGIIGVTLTITME